MKIWFEKGELAWQKYVCNTSLARKKGMRLPNLEKKEKINPKESGVYVKHTKNWCYLFGNSCRPGYFDKVCNSDYDCLSDFRSVLKQTDEDDINEINSTRNSYLEKTLCDNDLKSIQSHENIVEFIINFDSYMSVNTFLDKFETGGPFTDDDYKQINGDWSKLKFFKGCYQMKEDNLSKLRQFIRQVGNDINLNWIDTSRTTDMSGLFSGLYYFNGDISQWNVSKVTNMEGMFKGCAEFNCDISKWNVEKVENMDEMFSGCLAFDHSLKGWKIGDNTSTKNMFRLCGIDDDNKPLLIK